MFRQTGEKGGGERGRFIFVERYNRNLKTYRKRNQPGKKSEYSLLMGE